MAYAQPVNSTKLIDAATVANAAYSDPGLLPLKGSNPVVFYVAANQTHDVQFGTVSKSSTTVTDLDIDNAETRTGVGTTAAFGTNKYTIFHDAQGGYAWCRVKNASGGADAAVTIYGSQL
jgi:hypothetical protein